MGHNFAGQINLTYSLLLPILAYLILRWRDESISARTFVILAGLTMALQFYLFMEIFADMTAILAVGLVIGIWLGGRDNRPALLRLAWLTAWAYAIALVLAVPYLAYALTTVPPKPATIPPQDLAGLVIPTRGTPTGSPGWRRRPPRRRGIGRRLHRDTAAGARGPGGQSPAGAAGSSGS